RWPRGRWVYAHSDSVPAGERVGSASVVWPTTRYGVDGIRPGHRYVGVVSGGQDGAGAVVEIACLRGAVGGESVGEAEQGRGGAVRADGLGQVQCVTCGDACAFDFPLVVEGVGVAGEVESSGTDTTRVEERVGLGERVCG